MPASHQKRRVSLQTKVLLPVLAMLVLILGSTLWLVNQHIREEFRAGAAQSLATADAVFLNSQKIRIKNLLLRFRTVPNEPRFKAVCQLGDPATFRALLAELLDELGAEAALFTTPEGKVLASTTRHPMFSQEEFEAASSASINQAMMDGQPNIDLMDVGGRFLNAVSIPSTIADHLVGVLTFAMEMGESAAQEFKQLTHAEVILVMKNHVAASTMIVALPEVVEAIGALGRPARSARLDSDSIFEIILGGEHYLGTSGRLTASNNEKQLGYILLSSSEQHLSVLRSTQRRIGLIGLVGIVLSTAVLWPVIQSTTRPLRELRNVAEKISRGDFSSRVPVTSSDECGELAGVFNQMTENLTASRTQLQLAHDGLELRVRERTGELSEEISRRKRAQQELLEAARLAGMAEVATGVLHNVGNVLNSVNVSASLLRDNLNKSQIQNLVKATNLLRDHADDTIAFLSKDPRGQLLPGFLIKLSEHLASEQRIWQNELEGLCTNIEHIKKIVSMQQRHVKVFDALEPVPPAELVQDALRMNAAAFERSRIQVVREFNEATPTVFVDRHKVLQIIINLLHNARDAMEEQNVQEKRLVVRVELASPDRVRITVSDNGVGIAPGSLVKIFNHGFTTKKDGHGFGLHSSANAAIAMGGSLTAHSAGVGQGAEFALELSVKGAAPGPDT
ncbi:MAG: HAMP domain-containing protein [Pedosphaera sp.]|nr:HAMP domain-containing protein [Pedosphaera sp.]